MKTIRDAMDQFVKNNPAFGRKIKGFTALDLWAKMIDVKGKSWATLFKDGILYIGTEDPSYGQEIRFSKPAILNRINTQLGEEIVSDIRTKIMSRPESRKESDR